MRTATPYILAMCTGLMFIHACKVGPEYQRPELETQDTFWNSDDTSSASLAILPWWGLYRDTVLQGLIETAIDNNKNLEASVYRVLAGHEQMGIVRANLYPQINYGVDASATFTAKEGTGDFTGSVTPFIDISYQVDLWGELEQLNDAAMNEYLATNEAYNDLLTLIIADVAQAYLILRDLDNRLIIAEQTIQTWEDNLDIVNARLQAGMVSEVDQKQAQIQLSDAKVSVKTFERLRGQTENIISTLLGDAPRPIERGLPLSEQVFPPEIPIGVPGELLNRRPDLRQSERKLAAQTARVGVAEARRYPRLILSSNMAAQFANPIAGILGLSAQALGPLFNAGANKRRVQQEIYRTKELIALYEQDYLNAVREVEDAMIAYETYKGEYEERQIQVAAANEAVNLTWTRYESGLNSYLEVLDLQRSQFSSQLRASEALQLQLTSIVQLYLALGGGW